MYWWGYRGQSEAKPQPHNPETQCQYAEHPQGAPKRLGDAPAVIVCFKGAPDAGAAKTADNNESPPKEIGPLSRFVARRVLSDPVALFTVVLALFTWRLIVVGRDQHSAAVKALAEATKAADAAVLSAQAVISVELPTLRVHSVGFRSRGPQTLAAMLQYPRFDVVVKNYGRTPAFLLGEALCVADNIDLSGEPNYSDGAVDLPPSAVIEAQDIHTLEGPIQYYSFNAKEVADLIETSRFLYVYGYIFYRDFLREKHMLKFIYELYIRSDGSHRFNEIEGRRYSESF